MVPKTETVKLGLPKGRMQEGVFRLLNGAGIRVCAAERTYRPAISLPEFEVKILKPQNIIEMLAAGSRDIGFAGKDWVEELEVDVVELLDTGLDPVRLVAAAPSAILDNGRLPERPLLIASEYERITRRWMKSKIIKATFIRSYGATEVFPPEDADCIVDNTASGSTLRANNLVIMDELMRSSTCLYANREALEDRFKREAITNFVLLLKSVLDAKSRLMVEINVCERSLDQVLQVLPAMKQPTIAKLSNGGGYAVKAAIPRQELPRIIPLIRSSGGTDIVVFEPSQIVV